jgi:DNA-binding PadR family transcriptional regulator
MDISGLKPAALHILLVLADGNSHGYGILVGVRERSGGAVPLGTGSLYRHLARLIDAGLVAEIEPPRTGQDPRRGASYRITARGRQALAVERRRLTDLLATMDGMRRAPRKEQA